MRTQEHKKVRPAPPRDRDAEELAILRALNGFRFIADWKTRDNARAARVAKATFEPCPFCGHPMIVTGARELLGLTWACDHNKCEGYNRRHVLVLPIGERKEKP